MRYFINKTYTRGDLFLQTISMLVFIFWLAIWFGHFLEMHLPVSSFDPRCGLAKDAIDQIIRDDKAKLSAESGE